MNPLQAPSGITSPSGVSSSPVMAADDQVAERFRQAMQGPAPDDGMAPVAPPDLVPPSGARAAPATLGEGILSTITTLGADLQASWTDVKEGLSASETPDLLSASELMTLQFKMLSFNALNEVVSKGVAKATQDLEQLLKTQ